MTVSSVDRIKSSPSYAQFVTNLGEEDAAKLADSIALTWDNASIKERDDISRKANASVVNGDPQSSLDLAQLVGRDSQSSGQQPMSAGLALIGIGFIILGASTL